MHYGAARMAAHWGSVELAAGAKAYWARKLAHINRDQALYALRHLPQHPPTPDEFLAVARRAPAPEVKMITEKVPVEERKAMAARLRETWARIKGGQPQ